MGWDWGMQHCVEIMKIFNRARDSRSLFLHFRPGFESAKKVSETEQRVELIDYILQDTQRIYTTE
jgi:hypothetical protein